jgi:acyl-homoserine lactone acylase PvdQ
MLISLRRDFFRCSHCNLLCYRFYYGCFASILVRSLIPHLVPIPSSFSFLVGASLQGTVYINGNSAPATVQSETNGFMHIVAANPLDVYRTLGFVSSKQRLLQMDFQRRVGRGNLSAFLGSSAAVPIDIYFRQLGWYQPLSSAS